MKQGKHYTTVILWIFIAAIAAYFGYNVVSSLTEPLTTASVIEYEAGAGCYTTGFLVRDEEILTSAYDITVITCAEGAHVSANEAVATGYLTDGAQQRQTRIQTLQEQLTQLQYAYSASSSLADQAALDEEISSDLLSLAKFTARRDMNSAQDLSPELKGLVLRRLTNDTDSETIHTQLETIQDELTRLQAQAATDTRAITADHAGTYSGVADGYESVLTPEKLQTMTAQDYNAVTPESVPENAIGKLIRGTTWYYVTTLPASELKGVKEGASVQLLFARDVYDQMDMTVERVGNNEAGYRLLVLSCNQYIQNVTLLRQQSADVVFNSYQGLRVPKDAVRVEDGGQTGVYVLEGATARWKPITILHDNGESYVVELDKTSTANLWPGDEVIIHAKNLYDGKVVGK
ncbi:MAG: hypothetical protein KH299_04585 [Firmicutes bacterium]|nr:hypothetical protein [Bacillota bacterium]